MLSFNQWMALRSRGGAGAPAGERVAAPPADESAVHSGWHESSHELRSGVEVVEFDWDDALARAFL